MKRQAIALLCINIPGSTAVAAGTSNIAPAPNGIAFPADYPNWRMVSLSHRVDNKTMRVIQ